MKTSIIPSLLLAAFTALPLAARERTATELCDAAASALSKHHAARARSWADSPIQVLQRQDNISVVGYSDGGYALVSHDDAIPAILGYSDEVYNPSILNPVFNDYLRDLDGYIDYCLTTGSEFRAIRRAGGKRGSVGPLITTLWDQGFPYYNDCPMWQAARCVTGCVATAAAMILNYHQLPKTMHGRKIYTYTNQGNGRTTIDYTYSDKTFDWDNMRDTYTGNGITRDERLAVAALMYACGVNASMNYTTSESGAFTYTEADGINWFMDGVRAEYYNLNGNEQLLYDELDAERPLLYSGAHDGSGHAFVVDGYDEEGLLHCNLGWSGAGNDYYLMTNMAGYSNGQAFVTIYPSEEPIHTVTPGPDTPQGYVTVDTKPAEDFVPDSQWYVLYNVGRSCHPYSSFTSTLHNTCYLPFGDPAEVAAAHIVRFVTSTNEKKPGYFIQTGEGLYYGSLTQGGNKGCSKTKTCNYSIGLVKKDQPGYFYIHDEKNDLIMDSNGAGADMVGYGNQRPSDIYSNASWQLYPVHFEVPEGIESVAANVLQPVIGEYDLNGRPASSRTRILIKEGRKVIK